MSDFERVPLRDIEVDTIIPAATFQGLVALDNWLRGFSSGPNGKVPGHFELTMHLRSLIAAEKKGNEDA
ncbi:hypothetical protein LCGC14_0487660 [marine sediment metagenome]|uniref:Uncharacterized protein n=1 Tax=marine sediment metagenome TaxID=412755 RepID=A0A0F9UUK6_9ZZZZ